jgi:DsbC/DsbD-like thiol-disulfide interchange protein
MKKYFLLTIAFLFFFIAVKAKHNYVEAELISEVKSIQPGKEFWVALKLNAKPEWHTYWRNPGDSGLPTNIKWTLPEGFSHSEIHWPNPHIFTIEGITNYGYEKEVVLPVKITAPQNLTAGKKITIKAKASWLACRVECVPEGKDLEITFSVKKQNPVFDVNAQKLIEKSLSNLPEVNRNINVSAELKENTVTIAVEGEL